MESLQEKAARLRANASPEERIAIVAHELGHYEIAKRAGVQPEGITIGHHVMDRRSASIRFGDNIDTGLTHSVDQWKQRGKLITEPAESERFLLSYLKSLYAGEAAEDIITNTMSNSGDVDADEAYRIMKAHGLPDFEIYRRQTELKREAWMELSEAETKHKLSHAARQLARNHFDGQKHPASTIEHYLNGGTRENLPMEQR